MFALSATAFNSAEAIFAMAALLCAIMTFRLRRVGDVAIWFFIGAVLAVICAFGLFFFEVRMTGGV